MHSVASRSALDKADCLTDTSNDRNRSARFGNLTASADEPDIGARGPRTLFVRRGRLYSGTGGSSR